MADRPEPNKLKGSVLQIFNKSARPPLENNMAERPEPNKLKGSLLQICNESAQPPSENNMADRPEPNKLKGSVLQIFNKSARPPLENNMAERPEPNKLKGSLLQICNESAQPPSENNMADRPEPNKLKGSVLQIFNKSARPPLENNMADRPEPNKLKGNVLQIFNKSARPPLENNMADRPEPNKLKGSLLQICNESAQPPSENNMAEKPEPNKLKTSLLQIFYKSARPPLENNMAEKPEPNKLKTSLLQICKESAQPPSENNMADRPEPNKLEGSLLQIFNKSARPPLEKPTIFQRPMRLIANVDGKTTCDLDTLAELSKIEKTLNVVSVVGSLRTGKSFLLNKLANATAEEGFETGHSMKAVTKGIWIMCQQHPTQKDQVLALLDTEGIDDPDKVEIKDDQWLFILSTLLSSTMVYNTMGNFDRPAIEKFKNPFLREIKTSISVTGADTDDSILDFFFPTFVLTLRDVTLDLGKRTPDVFLEEKLKLKRGQTDIIRTHNEPRQLIRRYFKKRRCFIFRKPVKKDFLPELMHLPERDLKPEFKDTLNSFRDYIFSCELKTLKSGRGITGRMLATLLTSYVSSIQDGKAPCLQKAMKTMSDVENKHAVEKAADVYNDEMKRRIAKYNTPTDTGLINFHEDSMKAALEILKSAIVVDDQHLYEEEALVMFKTHFGKFKTVIDKNSEALCLKRLEYLNLKIIRKKNSRTYCHPAGYDEYMKDIEWLIKQFNKDAPGLGTKAKTSLQEFLDSKEVEEEEVYQMVLEAQKGSEKPHHRVQRLALLVGVDTEVEKKLNATKTTKEEEIEHEIIRNISALQIDGIRSIACQYLEVLKMKIDELERVKSELSEDDSYYETVQQETEFWKKLWGKATWNLPQYKDEFGKIDMKFTQSYQKKDEKGQKEQNDKSCIIL